jgi:uncharacterized circularly permuted ATP-grasp superfamily protein
MYDEAYARPGVPRAHYAELLSQLRRTDLGELRAQVADWVTVHGVTFADEAFAVDPVPRVLTAAEWADLEAGLVQRVRALNAFVRDVHGPRRIIEQRVVPAALGASADHDELGMDANPIAVAALDVVRDDQGRFLVLEDDVSTPSGLAYAVAARQASDVLLPNHPPLRDVECAFDLLGAALSAAAPDGVEDPFVVQVSDGPGNPAWYEHLVTSKRLGIALVGVDDLEVRDGALAAWIDDDPRRVDVVYRSTNDERLVDVLLEPLGRGLLGCANALGAGVAGHRSAHGYVERMIAFYLGEEPLVRSAPSFDPAHRRSRHPTVIDGRLEPRHVDLRAFVFVTGDDAVALPGGLTRVQDDGAKDTWVLAGVTPRRLRGRGGWRPSRRG